MRLLATVAVAFLLSHATSAQVNDCEENDGETFAAWKEHQFKNAECSVPATGQVGVCSPEEDCKENQGQTFDTTSPVNCRKLYGPSSRCCVLKYNCTAAATLSSGGRSIGGSCLLPRFCTQGASAKLNAAECNKDGSFSCCVEQEPRSAVTCSSRYSTVFRRMSYVDLNLDQDAYAVFSSERLTNFLPFALKTFEELRDNKRCLPMGDCSGATYLAFVYHMLVDFTTNDPRTVLNEILATIPASAGDRLQSELLKTIYSGHITPEAFGKMMDILWDDTQLNLVQYNSGSCADWIRLSRAVRGPNSSWRCDDRWFALMASQYCRPTRRSNLGDCASGTGVCYLNGESSGTCQSVGLSEISSANSECSRKYGQNAVCCRTEGGDFDHNRYTISVGIESTVSESYALLEQIVKTYTEASRMLYRATENRAAFGTVRVILPSTWSPTYATEFRTDEKVSEADFIIQPDVSLENDGTFYTVTMHTIQLGYCGARGLGTRLTPRDLKGSISAANVAKHFGFNRYGIFKEFPRNEMEMAPLDALTDRPPRCVKDDSTYYVYCNESLDVVVERVTNVTGSLAWLPDYPTYPGVQNIVHFCDNRECDPTHNHNDEIDNTHNRICNKRSTMEIILENSDFYGSGTPPRPGLDPKPKFVIVHQGFDGQPGEFTTLAPDSQPIVEPTRGPTTPRSSDNPETKTRIVLVLDQSGSMTLESRMENLQLAASQFIDMSDATIEIGVVSFEFSAYKKSDFKRANDAGKASLKATINALQAGGGTCIEAGVNLGLSLLKATGEKGGQIILMTDGENGCGDYYAETMPGIKAQGAVVHTVAITKNADRDLAKLAIDAGGSAHMVSDGSDVSQFLLGMQSILSQATEDESTQRVVIQNTVVSAQSNVQHSVPVVLDMGLGDDTLVSALYDSRTFTGMTGTLVPPTDSTDTSVACINEHAYGKLNCALKFKPSAGQWTLKMTPAASSSVSSHVTVSASATIDTSTTDTFTLNGYIARNEISLDQPKWFWEKRSKTDKSQALVATLAFGRFAVIGARVEATITNAETGWSITTELSDNGEGYNTHAGADLYENDGIYTALLDQLNGPGRYTVSLKVTADKSKAFFTRDVVLGVPKSAKYLSQTANFRVYVSFTRVLSMGTFEVSASEDSTTDRRKRSTSTNTVAGDTIPDYVPESYANVQNTPGRISSLNLLHTSVGSSSITYTLTWLAVGKNGMQKDATPDWYTLVASTNSLEVLNRGDEIELAQRFDNRLTQFIEFHENHSPAGTPMMGSISLPLSSWKAGTKIYFAVTAYNWDLSNGKPLAGATSNMVVTKIEDVVAGVCQSDGTGNCSSAPQFRVNPYLSR